MPTITFPHKTKQFFSALLKLTVVLGIFYFIYHKLTNKDSLEFGTFINFLSEKRFFSFNDLLFLAVLSFLNWLFEIYKWRLLASSIHPISMKTSMEQTLGSLAASMLTPNRIGEYGAKAIYFSPSLRKRIMVLNLIGNLSQMCITTIFGTIGLCFFTIVYEFRLFSLNLNLTIPGILSLCILAVFILFKKQLKDQLNQTVLFLKGLTRILFLISLGLSFLRYATFSFQWHILLAIFGISLPLADVFIIVSSMYLLSSVIPSFTILDVVIKGGIAVYFFSLFGIPEIPILNITTLMWILNLALPSLFGSYFIFMFKQYKTEFVP